MHRVAPAVWLLLPLSLARADEPAPAWGPAEQVGSLADPALDESSGLASGSAPQLLWTHNDSGGAPCLFALDRDGRARGRVELEGATNFDWEDMAGFTLDGQRWLVVADTGDNARLRPSLTLYVVREPALPANPGVPARVAVERTIRFRYPDGRHDCEGLGVDVEGKRLLLVTKDRGEGTLVFALPLQPPGDDVLTAEPLGRLPLPMVTALDVSPDGRLAAVLCYRELWVWARAEGEGWAAAFARPGQRVEIPRLEQAEAVCFAPDGRTLYLSSEGRHAPLLRLAPVAPAAPVAPRRYY